MSLLSSALLNRMRDASYAQIPGSLRVTMVRREERRIKPPWWKFWKPVVVEVVDVEEPQPRLVKVWMEDGAIHTEPATWKRCLPTGTYTQARFRDHADNLLWTAFLKDSSCLLARPIGPGDTFTLTDVSLKLV